jgi:hypothetical protein
LFHLFTPVFSQSPHPKFRVRKEALREIDAGFGVGIFIAAVFATAPFFAMRQGYGNRGRWSIVPVHPATSQNLAAKNAKRGLFFSAVSLRPLRSLRSSHVSFYLALTPALSPAERGTTARNRWLLFDRLALPVTDNSKQ